MLSKLEATSMQPALRASCAMGFLMAACLVALPLPTSAVVYKWVDENGKVHYGERPPAGAHKQPVKVHTNPGATQSSGAPSTAERLRKQRQVSLPQRQRRKQAASLRPGTQDAHRGRAEKIRQTLLVRVWISSAAKILGHFCRHNSNQRISERLSL